MKPEGITSSWRLGAYASGNFGKNILWGAAETTLLFMLTDIIGLNAALAGTLLLASLVFDAALAPIVGHVADRFPSRIGKYGGLILIGAPTASLAFVALFSLPLLEAPDVWLILLLLLVFRIGYSLIDGPHNALMGQVRRDPPGRARLAGYRFFFSSLAGLVIAFSITPIISGNDARPFTPKNLFLFAMIVAGLSCVIMIGAWAAVRRADPAATNAAGAGAFQVGATLQAVAASPRAILTLSVGTIAAFGLPLFNKAVLYIANDVLVAPELASPLLISLVAGQFLGLPFWIWLSSTRGKALSLALSHGVVAMGAATCTGLGLNNDLWLLIGAAGFGAGASGVYTIIWGMLADVGDEISQRAGTPQEARLFAMAIFLQKLAMGLGVGLFGLALGFSGYNPDVPVQQANLIILTFGFGLPMCAALCCAAALTLGKSVLPV